MHSPIRGIEQEKQVLFREGSESHDLQRILRALVFYVAGTFRWATQENVVPIRGWKRIARFPSLVYNGVAETNEEHGRNELELHFS